MQFTNGLALLAGLASLLAVAAVGAAEAHYTIEPEHT